MQLPATAIREGNCERVNDALLCHVAGVAFRGDQRRGDHSESGSGYLTAPVFAVALICNGEDT
jgi:hypothetical protein